MRVLKMKLGIAGECSFIERNHGWYPNFDLQCNERFLDWQ